ncbi:MAG: LacI family DNA-binding transcriptional regulator [Pseudothermotoga sp.]|uniref:LacI family DNA-binding transcriptional regulator n=1 Tax=Pseudothermotoga sp. TaxID=2033661 RepID=UPI0019AEE960|nr:LacI family DNA-binding transcriptional regulator [Pseudothermotoga sp.]
MKVTLKQIARELGVNVSTVSRALNGKPGVSEELRKKILELAKAKGYSPDLAAVGLRKGKTKIIGVLIPDVSNPFFAQILRGMERVFYPLGYHLLLCSTDENTEKEEENLRTLLSQRVEGILAAPTDSGGNRSTYKKIVDSNVPLVFFDRIVPGLETSYVITDNEGGVAELVRYVYEKGHRSLGVITLRSRSYTGKMRLSGILKCCDELGMLVKEEWILDGHSTQEGAYQAAKKLFQLEDRPTSLIVCNNLMMLGVMKAVKELNVKVPEDISVVSFDDSYWNEIFDPPITCVAQEPEQMGLIAATMMMDLLMHGSRPTKTVLKAHFIERASVKQMK